MKHPPTTTSTSTSDPRTGRRPLHAVAKAALSLTLAAALTAALAWPASAATTQPSSSNDAAPGAGELVPLKARHGAYSIQVGKKQAQIVPFRFEPGEESSWTLTLEGRSVARFTRGEDGSLLVPRESDLNERVEVTYEPGLRVLPGKWEPGKPSECTSKMVIRNSKDGSLKEKGTCSIRVELVGKERVTTPAGEFDAMLVRETRQIRLRMAKADVTCETWYVPGVGEVAERSVTTTKALGLFGGKEVSESKLAR
ncbi:MAG: hypothetical protein NTW19_03155 [Planctomycetota bacterium]|nr:hypothetical protein [Planctomycetota bacterium]